MLQRLDQWLVVARFCKTRSVAADLIAGGRVRIAGRRVLAPDRRVRTGDVLTLALPHDTCVVEIRALAPRRGSPAVARALYDIVTAPADATA